jgi:uncharacterized protein
VWRRDAKTGHYAVNRTPGALLRAVIMLAPGNEETAMPYVIQTLDKPNSAELRAATRAAHLEYLTARKGQLLAAGAVINDDGTGGHGGILIVDTDDRAAAERFINEDPFTKAGLFQSVTVVRWRKAFFNGERLI